MNAKKTIATVLGLAVAATLAACSSSPDPEPPSSPTATVEPTTEPAADPTTPAPTEPATPEVVIPTEPGDIVPADQIDAAREAGVAVYVSPTGDGSGIVVDPDAELPEELIAEVETVEGIPTDAGHLAEQLGSLDDILTAHNEAGTKVIAIAAMANVTSSSAEIIGYNAVGTEATGMFQATGDTKAEALAAAEAYAAANPGTTIVDLTD
ncbi:hypothetical protein [Pseudactinotalea terrae]|uniref:hypothetical protein n=1 Tax=Pseudactinotalea terrae TaxID=1743262 RepID=UPI0012E1A8CD|nr:hypothetical protein [Pseudactinotalea terrae]